MVVLAAGCSMTAESFKNPDSSLVQSDLAGTWETHYGRGTSDSLTLMTDGSFQQRYAGKDGYVFETSGNQWRLEYLEGGQVYLQLKGGRYYMAGVEIAERDGMGLPCPSDSPDYGSDKRSWSFWDPYGKKFVKMVGELILNVRKDDTGKLVLYHMWMSSDGGFSVLDKEREFFHRAK